MSLKSALYLWELACLRMGCNAAPYTEREEQD